MQVAARAVAHENDSLRAMLRLRGVSDEEIEQFLWGRRRSEGQTELKTVRRGEGPSRTNGERNHSKPTEAFRAADFARPQNVSRASHLALDQLGAVDENLDAVPITSVAPFSQTTSLFAPREDESRLEMSCETAADIISSMRGTVDEQEARSQLGCEGRESCQVKTVEVLGVMGED